MYTYMYENVSVYTPTHIHTCIFIFLLICIFTHAHVFAVCLLAETSGAGRLCQWPALRRLRAGAPTGLGLGLRLGQVEDAWALGSLGLWV